MTNRRRELGAEGEAIAAAYLREVGFRVVERNYRAPTGEIDLIIRKGSAWHFIEVKTRRSNAAGDPLEHVTPRKQRQIIRAALVYCRARRLRDPDIHFSVVGVDRTGPTAIVEILLDAFEVPEGSAFL